MNSNQQENNFDTNNLDYQFDELAIQQISNQNQNEKEQQQQYYEEEQYLDYDIPIQQNQNNVPQQISYNKPRAPIKQNMKSKLVQQKYQFTNLNDDEQLEYEQCQQQNFGEKEYAEIQSQQKQIDFNDFIKQDQVDQDTNVKLDQNNNYENVFLGKEGMFKDYKIIVGEFYQYNYKPTLYNELQRIGFNIEVERDLKQFIDKCLDFDIIMIISNCSVQPELLEAYTNKIQEAMKKSKSLYLWADNTPFTAHIDPILSKFFDGMRLEGDYYGAQIVSVGDKNQKQKFDADHAIGYGLNNLHEGITICHPVNKHKDFESFAFNSNNEELVLYAEETSEHGRIVVDMGFTKLFPEYWANAGTHQYVSNATVWLTGIVV